MGLFSLTMFDQLGLLAVSRAECRLLPADSPLASLTSAQASHQRFSILRCLSLKANKAWKGEKKHIIPTALLAELELTEGKQERHSSSWG